MSDKTAIELSQKESEDKFRLIVANSIADLDGLITETNEMFLRILGYSLKEEVIGKPISCFFLDTTESANFLSALNQSGFWQGTFTAKRKDKSTFLAHGMATVIRNADGEIIGYQSAIIDGSERKLVEEELEESKEKYRGLSNATFEAIFISEKGICIEQNQAAEKIFGYTSEEAIGRYGTDWIAIEDRATVMKNMLAGYEEPYEVTALRKDGTTFPCLLRGRMMQFKGRSVRVTSLSDITERKQSEEALIQSEATLSLIYNNTSEKQALFKVEENNKLQIVTLNRSFIEAFLSIGFPVCKLKSLIGKFRDEALLELGFPKDSIDEEEKLFKHAIESGEILYYDQTIPSPSGILFAETSIVPMMDAQGKCTNVLYTSRDITERKQAVKALKESEQKFRSYTENAPDAILVINPDGFYLDANPAACKLVGYSLEELLKMNVSQIFDKEDLKFFQPGIEALLKEGKYSNEFKFVRKDDSSFIAHLSAVKIDDTKILGFVKDVTERKKAEEALMESEYFFKETQKAAFIGSYKTDFTTGFWKSSEVLDQIFGIDLNFNRTINGWLDLIFQDDKEMMDEYLRKEVILKGKPFDKEYRIKRQSDGEIRWVKGMGKVEFDSAGNLLSLIGTIQDITERKQAETAIIESQRLGAIGEMTSSIAHDFNNSLQSILGNLELVLLNTDFSDSTTHYLNTIKTVISDAAIRVKQLQRFTGKGQIESKYAEVNLNTLINEVISQSRPLWKDEAEKNGLIINIETEFPEIPMVFASVGELRSAFYNIIKNSIEAMPNGGKIFIKTEENSGNINITITDTGIGMNEETRVRIFQPFYTTKGFELGRGLGMSGVYSTIKEHKGDVFIKNTAIGKGTAIRLSLPVSKNVEVKKQEEAESKTKNSIRVLWVEDDAIIRKSTEKMIKQLGHNADTAKSGKEALEFLEQNKYDIVVTDIGMPEMTGWQLAAIIKEKFDGKMKVAVVTGWSSDIDVATKKEHGVEYVLGKPFSIEELKKLFGLVIQLNNISPV